MKSGLQLPVFNVILILVHTLSIMGYKACTYTFDKTF
jgi:hypothetical protein